MVKLRRSHLTILLLGVDQYGFMMRRQWLQEISTEHHPKVSQKIWTLPPHSCHSAMVLRTVLSQVTPGIWSWLQSVSISTDLSFSFACFADREDTDWLTDWPRVSRVSQYQFLWHHLLASLSFKTILQISAQSWSNGQAVSKNTNQSRWRLKSESLAVRFLNINYLEIWPELGWKPANPTGIECLVWVKWISPELLLSQ